MRRALSLVLFLVAAVWAVPVWAETVPVPRAAPRVPVAASQLPAPPGMQESPAPAARSTSRPPAAAQPVPTAKPVPQASGLRPITRAEPPVLSGRASILDSGLLQIAGQEVQLFGIVPPQLSASFGPQARRALEALAAAGNLRCRVRDRSPDAQMLVQCLDAQGQDIALRLLQQGLAVAARGSLSASDLAVSYAAAENEAAVASRGLWSVEGEQPNAAPVVAAPVLPVAPSLSAQAVTVAPMPQPFLASGDTFFGPLVMGLALVLLALLGQAGLRWGLERRELRLLLRAELRAIIAQLRLAAAGNPRLPRLRLVLFQACLPRLGMLGVGPCQKIAELYGHLADLSQLARQDRGTGDAEQLRYLLGRVGEDCQRVLRLLGEPAAPVPPHQAQAAAGADAEEASLAEPIPEAIDPVDENDAEPPARTGTHGS